ncbi:hypothetical protein [Caulobacter endophyticus]|uniref:hypothetical protein n=1 Tax=Caulobacter endophyticus TaxID=2172652 RepID=UPI0024104FE9|nr:hypothetical protein [Caulobacter endophyticus]MDG2530905.1 hypothetical protein [Caulobacter endophyticus]
MLAATVIWAVVTAPAFAIALLVALMLNGSGATPMMWLAAALPLSTAGAAVGSLVSGLFESPGLFKFSCVLPFLVLAVNIAVVALGVTMAFKG